ncbi:2-hydroxyacid dehydrogenase family protein [Companilactobacillus pabuli]|jgi:D-3-phosphoglycerate dehydrogenase|uniref:Hydroxyacid dehydrogenase n=1 Tax=Companilactobacillus pabuli TaxID=2714036 RepID=A0A7L7L0L2_9LACO|nr:2-hydroxyacid dehydrogenase family protein [Companilactobacillus pabuli]AKP03831.1 2-hydroxyacid dehydrogenase [Companilactobacillus farciminis]AKS52136.1 2-hydroxyacid dehydrogenase [Companilactobacillus farciminis]MDG5113059.1 2-hydroxyacid dehydrogenase family protein [Companilactobacillus pabuli]QMT85339.1 hydroxyacid dehydrogenase [Companilactobacillus pabuli]GAQ00950.1 2-hydroxyacid dehydrogenase [Companilactobacillus farciminis]
MSKVFIAGKIPDKAVALMKAANLTVDMYTGDKLISTETLKENIVDSDFLITPLSTQVNRDVLNHASKLKLIANFGAGTNNIDINYAKKLGIPVTNTPIVSTVSTAESTVGLIIGLMHRIAEGDHLMRTTGFNGWAPLFFLGHELQGKTLGIIGLGQIGQAVAKRMHAFDMPILYTQRHRLPISREVELGAKFVSQDELLANSDVVSLHLPLNEHTKHLLGADEFKQMKSSAVLINAARGPIIDESALTEALKQHIIAGAALDVYEHEPKVSEELKQMKNVLLTPHLGNATIEARDAMAVIVAENVIAAANDQPIKYIVNNI